MWNGDADAPTEDKDWEELAQAEKQAAKVVGFDQEEWDEEQSV